MNLAMLQDIRSAYTNQLYFFILAMTCGHQIKNTIPLLSTQKIKYLDVNLSKHVQGLYAENFRMPMKEIEDLDKQRHTVFIDQKTHHSKGVISPQIVLQAKYNYYQKPSKIILWIETRLF